MEPVDSYENDDELEDISAEDRTRDYSGLKSVKEQLGDIYAQIEKGFEDKQEQNDIIDECWDIYHCNLNENQVYVGSSKVYVPIVRDAMTARETRFVNMLFPQTGRYCEIVGNEGKVPYDLIALMDYYVRQSKLREAVVPALIRSGDISGQYNLYLEWMESTRCVVSKKKVPEKVTELNTPMEGAEEYDDIDYEEIKECRPGVMVLDSRNLLILPVTVDRLEDAEIVCVTLRFTKKKIQHWINKGIFEKKAGEALLASMSTGPKTQPDTGKKAANAAGVKTDSKGNKVALVHQVWCKLKIKGEQRLMVTHFGGPQLVLGCKRNPYWCDRIPVISQPVEKNPDTIWGKSQVDPVKMLQYQANDYANMGLDSGMYAMCPIVMTDPEKNPQAGSMVLAMASVWLTDPNSTKFAEFPPVYKEAFQIIGSCKDQIFQSLGVNPAMIPHGNAGKKPSQAQIAQEQQVALESASDNVALIQEGVLGQLLEWFYELDYQYRTKAVTVKKFGQLGLQADMDQVEPFQVRERYEFKWYGTEGFKAVQQVQQMISWMGILTKLPPQQLNGRTVDMGPLLEYITEVTCGPRLAPKVLVDKRHEVSIDPETENELMENLFPVQVHPGDDDQVHIQSHFAHFREALSLPPELQSSMQSAVLARGHILEHIKSAKMKAVTMMQAQNPQATPPGGARPGAQVQPPTGPQQPPGAVHPDNMPTALPRRAVM